MNIVGRFLRMLVSEKTVQLNKKFFISSLIIIASFALDRFSKIYILQTFIEKNFEEQFINQFLNFILVWNKGIAFGLFQSETFFYQFISLLILLIVLFILYLIFRSDSLVEIVSFSMITGGALGNLFDRFYYQAVPDFIDFHYGDFHWFTFNVSDICISIGVILLLIFDMFKFKKDEIDENKQTK